MTTEIIDASHHQGNPDWTKVAAQGVKAVILKATEGTSYAYTDWYQRQKLAAQTAGLHVMAYHFANPAKSIQAQALYFCRTAGDLTPYEGLPTHWLDLETGNGDQTAFARAFLASVQAVTGRAPGFYSYAPHISTAINAGAVDLRQFPLWLAAYRAHLPQAPAPWNEITLWQNSSSGIIDGINAKVDTNVVVIRPAPPVPVVIVKAGSPEAHLLASYPALFGRPTRVLAPGDVPATSNPKDIAFGVPVWGAETQIRGKDRYETLDLAIKYLETR